MRDHFYIVTLLALVSACSHQQSQYSPLSDEEQQALKSYQLSHEFIPDCVTKKLAAINRNYCNEESLYCNIPPDSSFDYQQWLMVYQACVVK